MQEKSHRIQVGLTSNCAAEIIHCSDTEKRLKLLRPQLPSERQPPWPQVCLAGLDEFDVKNEDRVGRDGARHAPAAVAKVGRDGQLGPLAHRHLGQALLPASNHLQIMMSLTH